MKKIAFSLLILFMPFVACASIDANLKYGSMGAQVVELQEFLIDQGVFKGEATGNFYSLTLRAVKAFQTQEGITPVSGYVGPITRGVINSLLADLPTDEGNATTTLPVTNFASTTPMQPIIINNYYPQPLPTPLPVFGGIITPMVTPVSKAQITVRTDPPVNGEYAFVVSILDEKGKAIMHAPITLTTPEGVQNKVTNTITDPLSADWRTTFAYSPQVKGTQTLIFTSGALTASSTIDVQ